MRTAFIMAAAAMGVSMPASAATALDLGTGFGSLFGSRTATGTGFQDEFTFSTSAAHSVTSTIATQALLVPGLALSDLDFVKITLDDLTFVPRSGNTDENEVYKLTAFYLPTGNHTLRVMFNVDAALIPAGYAGTIVLGDAIAVPEPTTWAMFVGAFGIVGGSLRRRRRALASAA